MIFLSCPFTSNLPGQDYERVDDYLIADTLLMRQGVDTVGTLHKMFNEKILGDEEMDVTWEFWKAYTYNLIRRCDALYVLCLDGWKDSTGVKEEIIYAKKIGIPIKYVSYAFNNEEGHHAISILEKAP